MTRGHRKLEIGDNRSVLIRPARPSDAGGWISLLENGSAEGPFLALERVNFSKRSLARFLRTRAWSDEGAAIIAETEAKLVGQLSVTRDKSIYRHIAEIGMSVDPGYRRRGIGSGLIQASIDWAKTFGVEKLVLNVFPRNTAAISLYRKSGFVDEGTRKQHARMSHGYEDLMEMSLFLGGATHRI